MLADMAIGIESARLTYMKAAFEVDRGRYSSYYSSISKAYASDVANKCANDAVQVCISYYHMSRLIEMFNHPPCILFKS